MKIAAIDAECYRLPLAKTLSDSTHGDMTHFQLVSVRIRTEEGAEGVGYTYTVDGGGRAIQSLIEHDLKEFLLGSDPRNIERLWKQMWWGLHYIGRGGLVAFAMSAVDIALWDLGAKLVDMPLWQYLGGTDNRALAYGGGVDLWFSIDELKEQASGYLKRGFKAIKMKVGRPNMREDIERVAAMREFLGPDIVLMVDANMQWSVEDAIRAARAFEEHDVYWVEEPTIPDDIDGHVRIMENTGIPVATGENFHTIYEFQHMISRCAVSYPEPDVTNIGGITPWIKVARLAEAHNLEVTSHGAHDVTVHLLSAVPNPSYLEVHSYNLEPFTKHTLSVEDGKMLALDGPGHGIIFDWESMKEYILR